ncbi:hypothetical protein JQ594_05275 [Bradyrhizobium manausense]|uniref:hypothetical protein n=1 Tax=Bradyrhizobium manausense TaxID=989370 RepID=UPI001BADB324|nr:hypothetical protein [Bradyrhizobium manausense]MBR0685316.1 hypothetical protein [Bradyrhizobium manausense]
MSFSRFVQAAAVSLLLIGAFALPAHAQANNPIRSGNFYEDRALGTSNSLVLLLTFAQSPTDKFLNITNVSCKVTLNTSTQVLTDAFINVGTSRGANDLNRTYSILGNTVQRVVNSQSLYSITADQIFYKVGPGRWPSIEIDAGSATGGVFVSSCVIVGNLTDN